MRASPTGELSTEPVVVFDGASRQTLDIYDQNGKAIGAAVRVKDRYSQVGYRYHYELSDTQLRCVLRDVTRRRFGIDSWTYAFSVLGADGAELGTITQSGTRNDSYVVATGGPPVAAIRRVPLREATSNRPLSEPPMTLSRRSRRLFDRVTGKVWSIEDEPGHTVARITHLTSISDLFTGGVAYVVELEPRVDENLRPIALTFCIVADNRLVDCRGGGG